MQTVQTMIYSMTGLAAAAWAAAMLACMALTLLIGRPRQ